MTLSLQMFERSIEIEDHLGKPLEFIDVYSKSLSYIKGVALKKLESAITDHSITEESIHWIITVPSIYDKFACLVGVAAKKVKQILFYVEC